MAYGIKYRHGYCNEYGVNSTVTILENGYSGAVKEIDAQEDPIVISQEGSDTDKFDTIRPSTASIGLIGSDDFKLEELFTADERKYMVENHIGGVMVWRGFVIPNGFSHEWTGGTFPMEIIASDNLSTLKDFPFLNDNGTVIKGRLNHIDILLKCLNKLDIGIDLLTLTNIVRQGGVAGEDPLFINTTDAYTFLNTDVKEEGIDFYYDNPQNAFNCEDVVNSICRLYGAKLYQSKGQWRFKRVNVDYGASISGQVFNRYNTLGVKIGTVPYNEVIVIPCTDYSGEKAQYSGARLAMSEVYKSAHSRYGFRYLTVGDKLPPIIKNQDLRHESLMTPITFVPIDWTVKLYPSAGTPSPSRSINMVPEDPIVGDFPPTGIRWGSIRMYGGNRRGGDSLRSAPIQNTDTIKNGDRFSLKFWHKTPLIYPSTSPISYYLFVRVILQTRNAAKIFVLSNSDTVMSLNNPSIPRLNSPTWQPLDVASSSFLPTAMSFVGNRPNEAWVQEYLLSTAVPEDGTIIVEFAGIGIPEGDPQSAFESRTGTVISAFVPSSITQGVDDYSISYTQQKVRLYNDQFKIAQLEAGILVGGSSHPSGIKYSSEQSAKYTQRGSELSLLTSDVDDRNAINGILTNGVFIDKWNDSRNPYNTFKPLGLMLTRDIMRQYKNVWRVIEEDIKANGLSFDTTIEFEERTGERYVIQRGSISQKLNRLIGATLIQVSANPDTSFVGTEIIEEDFKSEGGSGGGSSGGAGSGSGGGVSQDWQSVTDIGAETTHIVTARGIRIKELVSMPLEPPKPEDIIEGEKYFWIGKPGQGAPVPPVGIQYFKDLLDVTKPLNTGWLKFDQVTGMVYSDPNGGGGDATQAWVEANFEHKFAKNTAFNKAFGVTAGTVAEGNDPRILHGETAYGWVNGNDAFLFKRHSTGLLNNASDSMADNVSWFDYNWANTGRPGSVIKFGGFSGYAVELFGNYNNGTFFGIRSRNGDGGYDWNPVRELWHSGNHRSDASNDLTYLGINATANNAIQWNGQEVDFSIYGTSLSYLAGKDGITNRTMPFSADQVNTFLGMPGDGDTLQSVMYRSAGTNKTYESIDILDGHPTHKVYKNGAYRWEYGTMGNDFYWYNYNIAGLQLRMLSNGTTVFNNIQANQLGLTYVDGLTYQTITPTVDKFGMQYSSKVTGDGSRIAHSFGGTNRDDSFTIDGQGKTWSAVDSSYGRGGDAYFFASYGGDYDIRNGGLIPKVLSHHTGLSLSAHDYYQGTRIWAQKSSPYGHDGFLIAQFTSSSVDVFTELRVKSLLSKGALPSGKEGIDLLTPFSGGLSAVYEAGSLQYGLHVITAPSSGNTYLQSKYNVDYRAAYNLMFQGSGGGVGIGINNMDRWAKFQVGKEAGLTMEGSVYFTQGSSTLTGHYTRFTNDFKRGQRIHIDGFWFYVVQVHNDVQLDVSLYPTLEYFYWPDPTTGWLPYSSDTLKAFSVSSNGDSRAIDFGTTTIDITDAASFPTAQPKLSQIIAGKTYIWIKKG